MKKKREKKSKKSPSKCANKKSGVPLQFKASNLKGTGLQKASAMLSSYLRKFGYDPVLTGKTCAVIHSRGGVKAGVIDLVIEEYEVEQIDGVMAKIGFKPDGLRHFVNRNCPYEIYFVPPPLAVGDAIVEETMTLKTTDIPVKLLTPTDCVRQRLACYYRWGDKDAFEDAVRVAMKQEVDMELVRKWSDWEWCGDKFREFVTALEQRRTEK